MDVELAEFYGRAVEAPVSHRDITQMIDSPFSQRKDRVEMPLGWSLPHPESGKAMVEYLWYFQTYPKY